MKSLRWVWGAARFALALLAAWASVASEAISAPGDLLATYKNPTPATTDNFGVAVAALGANVLVGAFQDDTGATNAGSVYLFDGQLGTLLLTINNPTPQTDDQFGWSIAPIGGNILVGVRYDNTNAADSGVAYLFDGSLRGVTNVPLLTINNPTPAVTDLFGATVAALGGDILVGAPNDDSGVSGIHPGAAYLFDGTLRGTTSAPLLEIQNPEPADGDSFGVSVAALDGKIIVGAYLDDAGASNSGSVYLFNGALRGVTNTPLLTLRNPTPNPNDFFGIPVAALGGNILTGSYQDDIGATNAGLVYLFDGALRGTFSTPLLTIRNPLPGGNDYFGSSIATAGTNVIVGAYNDSTTATNAGSVDPFDGRLRGTISNPLLTIPNPSPVIGDLFGRSVSAFGCGVLAGAQADDPGTPVVSNAGSAYYFQGASVGCGTTDPTPTPILNTAQHWMEYQ